MTEKPKNPFFKITKTATESKKEWKEDDKPSSADSRRCSSCGAARPKNTNLLLCGYCGTAFMDIDAQIRLKDE